MCLIGAMNGQDLKMGADHDRPKSESKSKEFD